MTAPVRHDPVPFERICLDEFGDDKAICVCRLPEGHEHDDDWHDCQCGSTWTAARIAKEVTP